MAVVFKEYAVDFVGSGNWTGSLVAREGVLILTEFLCQFLLDWLLCYCVVNDAVGVWRKNALNQVEGICFYSFICLLLVTGHVQATSAHLSVRTDGWWKMLLMPLGERKGAYKAIKHKTVKVINDEWGISRDNKRFNTTARTTQVQVYNVCNRIPNFWCVLFRYTCRYTRVATAKW